MHLESILDQFKNETEREYVFNFVKLVLPMTKTIKFTLSKVTIDFQS